MSRVEFVWEEAIGALGGGFWGRSAGRFSNRLIGWMFDGEFTGGGGSGSALKEGPEAEGIGAGGSGLFIGMLGEPVGAVRDAKAEFPPLSIAASTFCAWP